MEILFAKLLFAFVLVFKVVVEIFAYGVAGLVIAASFLLPFYLVFRQIQKKRRMNELIEQILVEKGENEDTGR